MRNLIRILTCTTWFVPFFDTELFIYPSLSYSLLWGVLSCVLFLLTMAYSVKIGNVMLHTKWEFLIVFYIGYLIIHSCCATTEYYRLYYYLSGFLFLFAIYHGCKNQVISFVTIKHLLIVGLIIQLIFIFGQVLQLWQSNSSFFPVTGCYENPNVAAMYITIVIPFILNELYNKKLIAVYSCLLFLSLTALYFLNCRTAWLAIVIPLAIFFINPLYHILKYRILQKAFVASCTIFVLLFISFLYQHKQDSTDGRTFIWEISAKEIIQNPQGNGYGRFAAVYNLRQSDYFKNHHSSEAEQKNARFTAMAYNDYLENGVDGGIAGMLLHIALIVSFIYLSYKERNKVTFSIFLMVATMSCVNFFTISILPWIGFLMVAGYTLSIQPQETVKPLINKVFYTFIIILALSVCYKQVLFIVGQYTLAKSPKTEYENLQSLSKHIGTSELYHRTLIRCLLHKKEWQKAVQHCNISLQYTSYPSIYQMKANALLKENKIKEAESTLQILRYMVPTHLGCRFQLLQLYRKNGFSQKAHDIAHEIVSIKPKTVSKETIYIQNSTLHYLKHIHHEHNQQHTETHH